ncbi:hypothetical protein FOXG_14087 [Fusarium oxysporum f. sp. lycopersici 4287]|uniref:Uncharacterized protein n=1 Tax=Fusarium oxysporum f. sp. lycopersici (strain 4287 / CBS 123668 / FGSC 9935 / NRRL 34936) TaxID=426428 RepID=A0A0J9WT87_FUSO4|nr:hypothetical protein FOXG_12450 [Fusarium oxysporum f. sp. lycopersici 4287]XP_018253647.1 hypothetical protein FOXG_14087 [Fusarium oxysporum f. sp. lycopersici 4287]EWZ77340.1 hypothetical protein FOWG_18240 [Fusarium oxysporum f. sp. lycopersici MN25]KAJ9412978.1 hypothetical protein QL093DRAFT_2629032 [Fusarium oxysporum]KNB13734.1 hypothetical protein FOXG_12450 [Fusarium oxysporum f. sp. lycopersici 4287]KNB15602.1 hypothetical protein FOXG_14087 [Fusarium oxysporum f. sp. lycopersici
MHFTTAALSALLTSAALAVPFNATPYDNPDSNIFPDFDRYSDWAICKGKITKDRFPNLRAPNREGGCVRYYQGIDMTGVITEQHFFFKDGFKTAPPSVWRNLISARTGCGSIPSCRRMVASGRALCTAVPTRRLT